MNEYYNHWLPKLITKCGLDTKGITIKKSIFYRESKSNTSTRLKIHEREHVKQFATDGTLYFLTRYIYEYIRNRFKGMKHRKAYLNISYEIKARQAAKDYFKK